MGASILAVQYRPKTFVDVVGQRHIVPVLRAIVRQSDRTPPALLFSGTRGTGKTTCARILAAALNCEHPTADGDCCGTCAQCVAVQRGVSTSVLEIDAASNGGVAEIRRIKDLVLYAHDARWRVVLLDEAQSLSKEANNALLKMLEEPPPYTTFVLVTTEPDQIFATVRSRAMPFEFRRLRRDDLVGRLSQIADFENLECSEDLYEAIAESADGGMRDAIMVLDQASRAGVCTAAQFREFYGIQDYSVPLMWSAIRGDHAEGYRLVAQYFARAGELGGLVAHLTRLVSELLVIRSQGRPRESSEVALAERVEMAQAVRTEALVRVVEVLWDLHSKTLLSETDQRSAMEMAFALIASALRYQSGAVAQRQDDLPSVEEVARLLGDT